MADYGALINQAAVASGGLLSQDLDRISRERVANRQIDTNQEYTRGILGAQDRTIDLKEQEQKYTQWKDIYSKSLDTIIKSATELRAQGKDPTEIMAVLSPAMKVTEQYEQRAAHMGLQIQPGHALSQLQAALTSPTDVEIATVAGTAAGTQTNAAAQTMAPVLGPNLAAASATKMSQALPQADAYGNIFDPVSGQLSVDPAGQAAAIERAKAGKSTTINQVGNTVQGEAFKQLVTEPQLALQKYAASVRDIAEKTRNVNALLGDLGGGFDPWFAKAQAYLQSLGFDPGLIDAKKLGPVQAGEAIGKLLALGNRNTADGGGMPGAMSDADRQFLVESAPTLAMTPSGRQLLQKVAELSATRAEAMAKAGSQALDMSLAQVTQGQPVKTADYYAALDAVRNAPENTVLVGNEEVEKLAAAAKNEYFGVKRELEKNAAAPAASGTAAPAESADDRARKALGLTK